MPEWMRFGSPEKIQIGIRWVDDPEPQGRRPARYGWSMGQLDLRVAGVSVTATTLNGERQPYVGWYLSPFLDWLATNWAALLHEERFPWPNRGSAPAAIACNRALEEWIAAEDPPGQEHYAQAQSWYFRHGLRTAAAGGIFPDLFIRRLADDIELSWSGASMEFTRAGLAFESGSGQALLPVHEVEETLWSTLQWAISHPPKSSAEYSENIAALENKVESLRRIDESALVSAHVSPNMEFMQQNQQRTRWGHPMATSNLPMEHQAGGLSYRYWLHRDLGTEGKEGLVFVMLNPSTATATKDDPTIRKCSDYALAWGYREHTVVNLYALRTTDPAGLWRVGCSKAVGEHNDAAIKWAAANANLIVCAWGNHGQRHGRGAAVLSQLPRRPHCLRMTRSGQPASPLRLPKDLDPTPMQRPGAC